MGVKERIIEFCDKNRISTKTFQNTIGVSGAYIANISKSIGADVLLNIEEKYPSLNPQWLILGTGTMLKEEKYDDLTVPLVPLSFQGMKLHDFYKEAPMSCERIVSPLSGADLAYQVTCDDMYPRFQKGTYLLLKEIDIEKFIAWGSSYLFDTVNGVLVRFVYPVDNDNTKLRLCCSSEIYPDITIDKKDVWGMYKIMVSINLH